MSDKKAQHTPGPWRVYPAGSFVPHYDVCDRIVSDFPSGRSASDGPSDADAALIAAAPDLLAALDLLYRWEDGDTTVPALESVLSLARAAIAKARGES